MQLLTGRPWWRRLGGRGPAALSGLLLATAVLPLAAVPAHAAGRSASALGPQGFPLWYEDDAGQRLDLCLDNLNCLSASVNLTRFAGGEAAYWSASALPPAPLTGNGLVLGAEVGFDPTTGAPVTFGRIRIRLKDLEAGGIYTVTHPYGQEQLVADVDGEVRQTVDVGCVPPEVPEPVPGTPLPPPPPPVTDCDFATALGSKVFDGFLRWDPNVSPAAPAGFLGDAITPHAVVGAPTGNNFFEVVGPGVSGRTTEFTVEGRYAAPVAVTPAARAFGDQKVGSTSTARTVSVLNTSGQNVTLRAPTLTGAGAGDFSVLPSSTGATCAAGMVLGAGATCSLALAFQPGTSGFKVASLTLPNSADAGNLVASVAVSGTGALSMATVRRTMDVGDVGVGQTLTVPLTVISSGDVDLAVSAVRHTGSAEFGLDATACTTAPVKARRSCAVRVTYRPKDVGADKATVTIVHDGVGSPSRVGLTGHGVDVTAPTVTRLRVQPHRFNPAVLAATVRFGLDGAGNAMLRVTRNRKLVRALGSVSFAAAGSSTMRWNGRDDRGRLVGPGTYAVTVVAHDRAGNTSSRSTRVVVVR